jgi:hypothetical protein
MRSTWVSRWRFLSRMRTKSAIACIALILGLAGCGGSGSGDSTASQPTVAPRSGGKPTGFGRYVQKFGTAASPADRAAVAATVEDFYTANADADGAKACATLTTRAQRSVIEEFGHLKQVRGRGCGPAYTAQLGTVPAKLRQLNRGVVVTGVRVKGDRGYVMFKSVVLLPSELPIRRLAGAWKLDSIAASPLAG